MFDQYQPLLATVNHLLPPQVGGIAAKVSSDCLMAYICDIIEDALVNHNHKCGLIVDLQKCFNLIPRKMLEQVMRKYGIPQQYVIAHQSLLRDLSRFLELMGQVGDEHHSSRGVPEGCAFSVVSMVVLTAMTVESIREMVTDCGVTMFADNWGFFTDTVEQLQQVLDRLQEIVDALGMKIAHDKSWTWGTSTKLRKELKQVKLGGHKLQSKLTAKDLGCDVSYSFRKCKMMTKKRVNKAVSTLRRLKSKKIPKKFKNRWQPHWELALQGMAQSFRSSTRKNATSCDPVLRQL